MGTRAKNISTYLAQLSRTLPVNSKTRFWVILGIVLLIASISTASISLLHEHEDNYRQAEILVARIEGLTNRLKRIEIQVESEQRLRPELAAEAQNIRVQIVKDLDDILRLDSSSAAYSMQQAFQRYQADNEHFFQLITEGKIAEATEWDEEHSDPSYDQIFNDTTSASAIYSAEAQRANLAVATGSTLTMVLAVTFIGFLFWRFEQMRRSADLLAVEQYTLRKSEERFHSLVRNASDVIVIIDAAGAIQYHSPAAEQLWGYRSEMLHGHPIHTFVASSDRVQAQNLIEQSQSNPGTNITSEVQFVCADGSLRDFEVIVNNLLNDDGVAGIVLTFHDITQRKAFEQDLRHLAFYDPLTNLPNRALFMERLDHALMRAERRNRPVAVLFLDLDNFKVINDSLGHQIGDALLVAVARRIQDCLSSEVTVARLGGDEFTILLDEITGVSDATRLAKKISVQLEMPVSLANQDLFTTTSIGIALSTPGLDRPDSLLRDADLAMYRAKTGGKARYEVFDRSMNTNIMQRLKLETDLRRAIERDEFRLYYQPIVHLDNGAIGEVEALVRWEHPQRGIVAPSEFIPVAEETGMIVQIGAWVLREACRQTRAWQLQYPCDTPLVVSVNLSIRQFKDPQLVETVARILIETGLSPACLKLEITESAMMRDTEATIRELQRLKQLGVQLAVDDFGTGYSSLAYLKQFPIDVIKIDRSFINRIGDDHDDTAIVRSIIDLAKSLRLRVTSEGIETAEQWDHLRDLSCDLGQGYYFARPLTGAAFSAILSQRADCADSFVHAPAELSVVE